jgi:two-component system, chemotaxis family, protein-glutamate methylesterase/glutaminase
MLRVLIADDSPLAREALTRLINDDPEMMVVGVAAGGSETVEKARSMRPDLITLDLLMPDMDGVEATRLIMASSPTPIVLVSSTVRSALAATHFDALAVGAVDVVEKPDFRLLSADPELRRRFLQNLKAMSGVVTVTRRKTGSGRIRPLSEAPDDPALPARVALIAVGASTGGPTALAATLRELDPAVCPPVIVVQHMARGFIEGFAGWLASQTRARVEMAVHGEKLVPGTIYVAPDECHVEITPYERLVLNPARPVCFQQPSVDVLFESVAEHLGRRAIGVLLTGMGEDGARGLFRMRSQGAFTIAQDRESSAVYGMPAAAAERGAATLITNPSRIARALAAVHHQSREGSGRPS